MKRLPKARTLEIVERDLEDELLIYDLTTHRACTLNATSKIVFRACGERKTFDELKAKHRFTDELIYFALDQLKKQNLLAGDAYVSPFANLNRRDVIRKVGLVCAVALPVISSLTAPQAFHAASSSIAACQPCAQPSQCASGNCVSAYSGGSICSNGFRTDLTFRPGENIRTGEIVCPSFGAGYCCSGSSNFSAPNNICTCLPVS